MIIWLPYLGQQASIQVDGVRQVDNSSLTHEKHIAHYRMHVAQAILSRLVFYLYYT